MGFSRQEYADCKLKKSVTLKLHLLLFYATTTNHFLIRLYINPTTSDNQLSAWTEKKLQSTSPSQTCTKKKKRSWSLSSGLLQSAPLQLSESRWNHDIWEVCSVSWWDAPKTATPAASIGQQKGSSFSPRQPLTTCAQPVLQKWKELGYKVLLYPPYSPDLLSSDYHLKHFDNFLQGKHFHNQQEAENAFQEFLKS